MAIASGVAKKLVIKKETAWGADAPVRTGAAYLRRKTSDLSLQKETYQSNEIRSDYQIADFRHGIRSVNGSIACELSCGTYQTLLAGALRNAWAAAGSATASLTITAVAEAGAVLPKMTRAAGSWLTDGYRVGDIVIFTGFTAGAAANNSKAYMVCDITATELRGFFVDGSGVTAVASAPTITATRTGPNLIVPTSGHTDDSFAIEHYHSDITLSELFLGCKVNQVDMNFTPTGMSEITFGVMGKNLADVTVGRGAVAENTAYFTTPTAESTTGVVAGVNGVVVVNGLKVGSLTGLSMSIAGNMSAEAVVGSTTYADIAEGRVVVTGQLTAILESSAMRDYFIAETEVTIVAGFSAGSNAFSICLPRVKLGGASKDDGEKSIIQTVPFQALLQSGTEATTGKRNTTIAIVDTAATA